MACRSEIPSTGRIYHCFYYNYSDKETTGNNSPFWHVACHFKGMSEPLGNQRKLKRRSEMLHFSNIAMILALMFVLGKSVWGKSVW